MSNLRTTDSYPAIGQSYYHRQYGKLHWALFAAGLLLLVFGWFLPRNPGVTLSALVSASAMFVLALAFQYLTVCDTGQSLVVRFGPLPLVSRRIPYDAITSVRLETAKLIDGWGAHWIPFRGWTYNVAGSQCATVKLGRKNIRIGSDDAENLVRFLTAKATHLSQETEDAEA